MIELNFNIVKCSVTSSNSSYAGGRCRRSTCL